MFKLSSVILTLWFVSAAHLDRRRKSAAKWRKVPSARVCQTNAEWRYLQQSLFKY